MSALVGHLRRPWMTLPNITWAWHLWLTLVLVGWAAILAWPTSTFAVGHGYDRFAAICPDEQFWAAGFAVAAACGGLSCWAAWPARVAKGGRYLPALRMGGAVLMAFVHGMVAILIFRGANVSPGWVTYSLIMGSAYILMRVEYERS